MGQENWAVPMKQVKSVLSYQIMTSQSKKLSAEGSRQSQSRSKNLESLKCHGGRWNRYCDIFLIIKLDTTIAGGKI